MLIGICPLQSASADLSIEVATNENALGSLALASGLGLADRPLSRGRRTGEDLAAPRAWKNRTSRQAVQSRAAVSSWTPFGFSAF